MLLEQEVVFAEQLVAATENVEGPRRLDEADASVCDHHVGVGDAPTAAVSVLQAALAQNLWDTVRAGFGDTRDTQTVASSIAKSFSPVKAFDADNFRAFLSDPLQL